MRLTREQNDAWGFFSNMSKEITESLTKFSSWLIAIQGSALALLVANYATVEFIFDHSLFKYVLILYAINFTIGAIVLWQSMTIKSALIAAELLKNTGPDIDRESYSKILSNGFTLPFRLLFSLQTKLKKGKNNDPMNVIYGPAKLSQHQQILVMLQGVITVGMIYLLVMAVKI